MKNPIAYRKVIVSILAIVLLALGIQGIGYSQFPSKVQLITTVGPELSVDQIYAKTIRSLVWIVSKRGQGSDVLIDEELRLAVTNYHVTKEAEEVAVFFPMRALHGDLIDDRDFYLNKGNLGVLTRLGYAATGCIVAKDSKTDLAIVQLEGLPDTTHEIEHNFR